MLNIYYHIKRHVIKQTLLNLFFVRFRCRKVWLGAAGCGFHVCPDILPQPKIPNTVNNDPPSGAICYSAGVGDDISFDLALKENYNISELHLFDPTPLTIEWIDQQNLPAGFRFYPWGLSGESGVTDFYLSGTSAASSSSSSSMIADGNMWVLKENRIQIQVKSLGDIAKMNDHQYIDLLKMDIEGSEFDVIESMRSLDGLIFGQICVEFHQRFFPKRWQVLRKAIKTLSDCGYSCFAVNWNIMELSFVNESAYKRIMNQNQQSN
jgi:FkbM family methyltransferase